MAAPGKFNMVAEEGNKRKGGMGKAEVRQCAVDLVNWFERNMNQKPKGVGVAAIEGLEKTLGCELPPGLSLLLEMGGGDFWFYEKQALSADAIADAADKLDEGVVPFASDVDGNLYVCDINRRDAVFEWDSDGRGTEVAADFESFMEEYRNGILAGRFEYVEDTGVIEVGPGESKSGK